MTMMRRAVIHPPGQRFSSGVRLHGRVVGPAVLRLWNHQDLGLLQPSFRAISIAVAIAVAVTVAAVAARTLFGLGQGGSEDPSAGRFEPIERLDCCAGAGLAAF